MVRRNILKVLPNNAIPLRLTDDHMSNFSKIGMVILLCRFFAIALVSIILLKNIASCLVGNLDLVWHMPVVHLI